MWADNCWIFAGNMRRLRIFVNEAIDKLMDPDMTRRQDEDGGGKWEKQLANVVRRGVRFAVYRFRRTQGIERTLRQGMTSWWRDAHIYRTKSVRMRVNCYFVVNHAPSTKRNGSGMGVGAVVTKVKRWGPQIMRLTLKSKMKAGDGWVEYRKRTPREMRGK